MSTRPPKILRVSHFGRAVTDLEKAREFYELLGFVVEEKTGNELYLKGVEETQHHSLVLKEHRDPGMMYVAFRVVDPAELDVAREYYSSLGSRVSKFKEKAVRDAILVEKDPLGLPVVFYYDMDYTGDYRMKYHLHRGAPPLRLDHVTFALPRRDMIEAAMKYAVKDLGFLLTEYIEDDLGAIAIFLTKQQKPHDLAFLYYEGTYGNHHIAYYVRDGKDILRLADIISAAEYYDLIVAGPSRHGATQIYYLYVRDPAGGGVTEFITDNYLILDPDKWKPIRWNIKAERRSGDYWGNYGGRGLRTELFIKSASKIVGPV